MTDVAGFLRKTAERLRAGTLDAETAAQRLDDVAQIVDAERRLPPAHWLAGLHWTENAKRSIEVPEPILTQEQRNVRAVRALEVIRAGSTSAT